mgnify:CR=1 FL=1
MSKNDKNSNIDKNFFKSMNYEIAEEHGIFNNEDMKNRRRFKVKRINAKIKSIEDKDHIINPS